MYNILDGFFVLLHTLVIIFNITGWLFSKTRKLNLIFLSLTGFSWFILGIFYGWGYCFLTDWHWQILCKLDKCPDFYSYIAYLIYRFFSIRIEENIVDIVTVSVFFISFALSLILNTRDYFIKKHTKKQFN